MPGATFGTEDIGGVDVTYVEFALTDGGVGDDTDGTDGTDDLIVDQGGPPINLVPALSTWGYIAFGLLSVLGSLYYLRRKRTTA